MRVIPAFKVNPIRTYEEIKKERDNGLPFGMLLAFPFHDPNELFDPTSDRHFCSAVLPDIRLPTKVKE